MIRFPTASPLPADSHAYTGWWPLGLEDATDRLPAGAQQTPACLRTPVLSSALQSVFFQELSCLLDLVNPVVLAARHAASQRADTSGITYCRSQTPPYENLLLPWTGFSNWAATALASAELNPPHAARKQKNTHFPHRKACTAREPLAHVANHAFGTARAWLYSGSVLPSQRAPPSYTTLPSWRCTRHVSWQQKARARTAGPRPLPVRSITEKVWPELGLSSSIECHNCPALPSVFGTFYLQNRSRKYSPMCESIYYKGWMRKTRAWLAGPAVSDLLEHFPSLSNSFHATGCLPFTPFLLIHATKWRHASFCSVDIHRGTTLIGTGSKRKEERNSVLQKPRKKAIGCLVAARGPLQFDDRD